MTGRDRLRDWLAGTAWVGADPISPDAMRVAPERPPSPQPGGLKHYDRDGQPLDLFAWAELCEDPIYRRVCETTLDNGRIWVSTVWLGLNANLWGGPPLIFETMSFVRMSEAQIEERRRAWAAIPPLGVCTPADIEAVANRAARFPWEDMDCERWPSEAMARAGHAAMVAELLAGIERLGHQPTAKGRGDAGLAVCRCGWEARGSRHHVNRMARYHWQAPH